MFSSYNEPEKLVAKCQCYKMEIEKLRKQVKQLSKDLLNANNLLLEQDKKFEQFRKIFKELDE